MTDTARQRDRRAAFEEAAAYVEFYAEERMRLCGDSILHDPVLNGRGASVANIAASESLQIDGTINSAAYHAARDIAEHLRRMGSDPAPDQERRRKP